MLPSLLLVVALVAGPAATLPTDVWQIAPDLQGKLSWLAGQGRKDRAVLLIPGLKLHPLRPGRITRPELHDWQDGKSELVRAIARDADVFAFGYAQTVPVDLVAHAPGLRETVEQLRRVGYREVVLIGHSAGGVVARQFAENYPDSGVTKVIQVGAPNAGSEAAAVFKTGYPKAQAPFVHSLAPAIRMEVARSGKKPLGPKVEFACVVGKIPGINGDGLVPLTSQWSEDLQRQGVPAVLVPVSHWETIRFPSGVKAIAELAREKVTRWTPEQVETARRVLFREAEEKN